MGTRKERAELLAFSRVIEDMLSDVVINQKKFSEDLAKSSKHKESDSKTSIKSELIPFFESVIFETSLREYVRVFSNYAIHNYSGGKLRYALGVVSAIMQFCDYMVLAEKTMSGKGDRDLM